MLRIGEFSRLSRVSVRMLRHYHRLGLLSPSQQDPATGYRYYSAEQLSELNRILALQDLGLSLRQIGRLLEQGVGHDELRGMLKLKRAEVEGEIEAKRGRLSRIEARLREIETDAGRPAYDVVLRELRPELVAAQREVARDDDRLQAMFHELESHVAQHRAARADRPPLSIYHDPEYRERDFDVEVAVPLNFRIPNDSTIEVCELPGIPSAACVVHTGAYGTLYQAYNALLAWIDSSGHSISGPVREVYLRYGADGLGFDLPPTYLSGQTEQLVTELQLPVRRQKVTGGEQTAASARRQ